MQQERLAAAQFVHEDEAQVCEGSVVDVERLATAVVKQLAHCPKVTPGGRLTNSSLTSLTTLGVVSEPVAQDDPEPDHERRADDEGYRAGRAAERDIHDEGSDPQAEQGDDASSCASRD
ncbi:hypothetical protein GCM10027058_20120 [Microbacterium neimengense]